MIIMKSKCFILIIVICSVFLNRLYNVQMYYNSLPGNDEVHSIIVYADEKRGETSHFEQNEILNLLRMARIDEIGGESRYGVIDPEFITFFINSVDTNIKPHITLVLYKKEGKIWGNYQIKGKSYKLKNCDELYDYAVEFVKLK